MMRALLLLVSVHGQADAALERAGARTALPTFGTDPVFMGPEARYVVTVEAAGARCAVPADFDGDGDLDIVSVSSNDNTVAWYERLSDGSYGPKKMISRASNGARIVTTGDIDQDNKTDVIVASYYDHTVGWFRNTGGAFGPMNMITRTALSAQGVSVADIDNDGDLDVLSASSGDNTIAWYENIGQGKFCEVKNVVDTNAIGIRTVIGVDLNEDGFVDLAAASKDDNQISWYRNDGSNNFEKIVIDNTAKGAYSLVAEDVDKDGHLDLVSAANMEGYNEYPENGEGGKVSFYRNGRGSDGELCSFTKVPITKGNGTDFDWFVLSVWAGDLDKDGDVDVASASFGLLHQGGFSWYENVDGLGNQWERHIIYQSATVKTGHYILGADMDGDGDNDLIAVTNGDNKVQILTAHTACDNSMTSPTPSCCTSAQYWNGSSCDSCGLGFYLAAAPGQSPQCLECPTACPRAGLFFLPASCHSMPSCDDAAASVARCDCGQDRYLDSVFATCKSCPEGHVTRNDQTRTPADYVMVQRSFLDQTSYLISDLTWLGFNKSRCEIPTCSAGNFFNITTKACAPCAAGTFSAGGSVTACELCPAGSECPAASAVPVACQAGQYSTEGLASCISCGLNKKQPELWTTMKRILNRGQLEWVRAEGSSNESACGCDQGARPYGGDCISCIEGMDCRGMDDVVVLPGFASDESLSIFRCRSTEFCRGGLPGDACSKGRTGIACAECFDGLYPFSDGTCVKCDGPSVYPFIAGCCVLFMGLCMLYLSLANKDVTKLSSEAIIVSMSASMLLVVLQQLSVLTRLQLVFTAPLGSILALSKVFIFDIEVLNVSCVYSITPLSAFIIKLCILPLCAIMLSIIHAVHVLVRHRGRFRERLPALLNSAGTVCMVLFISTVATTLAPYQCTLNPNERWTAVQYESVVCWEQGTHETMLVIGAIAMLMPLAFVARCVRVILEYPNQVQTWSSSSFLQANMYLFLRSRPERYWYILVIMWRSLLVSTIPVIPNPVAQVLLFETVMVIELICSVEYKPHRTWHVNMLERWFIFSMILIIAMAPFFVDDRELAGKVAGYVGSILTVTMLAAASVPILYATRSFQRNYFKKDYRFFICHFKATSGNFARVLQIKLIQGQRGRIFMDADHMEDLSVLFDVVGSHSETILAVCSSGILERPWCVGELVSAHTNNVPTILLQLSDFSLPDENFIDDYEIHVPDVTTLAKFGIELRKVQATLRWLPSVERAVLPTHLSSENLMELTTLLLGGFAEEHVVRIEESVSLAAVSTSEMSKTKSSLGGDMEGACVIIVDHSNPEASMCAELIVSLVAPHFRTRSGLRPTVLQRGAALPRRAQLALVCCTNGAFFQHDFLSALWQASKQHVRHIPVLCEENFRLPSDDWLVKLYPMARGVTAPESPEDLLQVTLNVFRPICVVFQPSSFWATEQVLVMKAMELAKRMQSPGLDLLTSESTQVQERVKRASTRSRSIISQASATLSDLNIHARVQTPTSPLEDTGGTQDAVGTPTRIHGATGSLSSESKPENIKNVYDEIDRLYGEFFEEGHTPAVKRSVALPTRDREDGAEYQEP